MVRPVTLTCVALLAFFEAIILIATWNEQPALYGWNLGSDGATLIYVLPGGPAAKAGLRAGDRVDWPSLPLVGRANLALVQAVDPNSRLSITIHRGTAARTVIVSPTPWPASFIDAQRAITVAGLLLVAIGITLVHLRPSRMTWAFLSSSLLWAYPTTHWVWGQSAPWRFVTANGMMALLTGAYAAGILIFMSRFPSDRPRGPLVMLDRFAIPFGAIVAILGLGVVADVLISPSPPPSWALLANQSFVQIALSLVALGALTIAYSLTQSSDRQRIIPVLAAFVFCILATMARFVHGAFLTSPTTTPIFFWLIAVSVVTLAGAVAHGVIRHRVLDISFVVSRTLVYTILTSIIVGAFVLIDFLSSKIIEHFQITILLEACVALAFGIWLNTLHARIDRFVDSVLFRRRHLAQARLERAASTLAHAGDDRFVDEALVVEAAEALDLASAAVFRIVNDEGYERTLSMGWTESDAGRLSQSDHLVVNLRTELGVLNLSGIRWPRKDVPAGLKHPLVAIPLAVRHEMLGFVLYGGHNGGEALDPDEIRHLALLAKAAAGAYDHLQMQDLRRQIAAASIEIAQFRHGEELMRDMVQKLQSAPRNVSEPARLDIGQ